MASSENQKQDHIDKWTDHDVYQLYKYMDSSNPTFQTMKSNDPIVLAQEFQHTMDTTDDPNIRKIMGNAGEEMLNQIAPRQITYRHLAIITSRLIVLSKQNGEVIGDYTSNTLVTGLFERFAFEDVGKAYADKDWITVKLVKPEFLFTQDRMIALELFDAEKSIVAIDRNSELTIPVDAVQGRVYDPESLF